MSGLYVYRVELTLHATAYVKADSDTSALAITCGHEGLDVSDILSGLPFDDPNLPDFSLSPAMTVGKVESAELAHGESCSHSTISADDIQSITAIHMGSYTDAADAIEAIKAGTACASPVVGPFSVTTALDLIQGMESTANVFGMGRECGIFIRTYSNCWLHHSNMTIIR